MIANEFCAIDTWNWSLSFPRGIKVINTKNCFYQEMTMNIALFIRNKWDLFSAAVLHYAYEIGDNRHLEGEEKWKVQSLAIKYKPFEPGVSASS